MDETTNLFNREISWLKFNERVLQEAADPAVPLFERLNFLAIFSANLDEFFRVRVATLRSLLRLKKKSLQKLGFHPGLVLNQIHELVGAQQERFGQIFRNQIVPELERAGILLVDERSLDEEDRKWCSTLFDERIRPFIRPTLLTGPITDRPFLNNRTLYMVVELRPEGSHSTFLDNKTEFALLEIPAAETGRFIVLSGKKQEGETSPQFRVLFVDDLIRTFLDAIFPGYHVAGAYSIKLTRDADLDLADEYSGDLVRKIREGLNKRAFGTPSRFLYDSRMPFVTLQFLRRHLDLAEEDLVPGGKYHNFNDLFQFPRSGFDHLQHEPLPPLPHPTASMEDSLFSVIEREDVLIHMPYQSFDYVIQFLNEAAADPEVVEIYMTLYRLASHSRVVDALIEASRNGKRVTVFVEVKARFDEESNLIWAERLELAGAQVLYSLPGLKVHSKAALVVRRSAIIHASSFHLQYYAFLSTGNFNEKTARIYTDYGLFTTHDGITADLKSFFDHLIKRCTGSSSWPDFKHLLVAPDGLRKSVYRKIDREIKNAALGKDAWIIAKLNALEDPKMIRRLYRASQVGVRIHLIVRGICCLKPGIPGVSENITVRSIVDRFLEHSRIYWFYNNGQDEVYLSSADWMRRNLSERYEIAFPVYDRQLRWELWSMLNVQLNDNVKARLIDAHQSNTFCSAENSFNDTGRRISSQLEIYRYYLEQSRCRETAIISSEAIKPEDSSSAVLEVDPDHPEGR